MAEEPEVSGGAEVAPVILSAAKDLPAPTPFYAIWELTLACDQACGHCASRAGTSRRNELTTDESLELVRRLATLGVREVTLIGGEAYLRRDWLTIVAEIKRCGMTPSLVTGGYNLSPKLAALAHDAGLDSVSVSLDGNAATHDRLRGRPGSHQRATRALEHFASAGVATAVNTQINRASLPELRGVFDAVCAVGARSWQVQLTVPMGRASEDPDLVLQPYDLLAVHPLLAELSQAAEARGVSLVCGNNVGYFGPFERILRRGYQDQHGSSCGAGLFTLGIEADGTLKGCPSLATAAWSAGNVRDADLASLLARTRKPTALWGYCATCYYAEICQGGCTWMGDAVLGKPGNNPYCHHRALDLDARGLRERIVRTAPAPGDPFDRAEFTLVTESRC